MSEKYTTLKSLSLERDRGCPFSPDKIRILRRNEDGVTVLQIRLANNSDKVIVNAAVDIRCLPSGTVIKKVYSDISAAKGEFFGTKVPVEAGKETVDNVEISAAEAVFEDGTVWSAELPDAEGEAAHETEENIISEEAPDEAAAVPKAEPTAAAEKIPLLKNIGKNKLIAGVCGAVVVVIIAAAALGGGNDGGEPVSGTGAAVTNAAVTETTTKAETTETTKQETTKAETAKEKDYVTIKGKKYLISKTKLDLSGRNLTNSDIEEIGKFVNLEILYLYNNQISDISQLSNLTKLTTLYLDNNQISDISPLSKLTNLEWLYLSNNQISDVSPLSKLTKLATLHISDNQINDISALEKLNIEHLDWKGNPGFTVENYTTNTVTFDFDGGSIECVEYKYYDAEENEGRPEGKTEYINFSAKVRLDDYPNSENAINNALNEIGNTPTEEVLMASRAPDYVGMGMMSEHNQITKVFTEGNLLFVTTYYLWDGGGGTSLSVWGISSTYIFDMKTGKQLRLEQLFKDFDESKQLVVDYGDKYVKENIPYDVYSTVSYYEYLVESTWYEDDNWEYDGENFTVHFGWIMPVTAYKVTDAVIPADVIRPYFALDSSIIDDNTQSYENSQDSGYYDIYQYGYVSIDSDTLNVREEPSTSARKRGSLVDNAMVYVYYYTDGWYYICYEYDNLYGYVSSEFINLY